MTPERYRQLEELCHQALEKAAPERAAFVASACAGDEELRRELESLLASSDRAGSFLEHPPDDIAADLLQSEDRAASGRTIAHYQVRSRLGAGGMGEVYLAEDLRLRRLVALKLLPANLAADAGRRRRLTLEAQAASTLSHPNVAHIYEIAEADGVRFIAMEYVPGQTLSALLRERRLQPAQTLEIAVQVADALEEAHAKGIVHRDIKPLNIMITPRGLAKVLDFGLARSSVRASTSATDTIPDAGMDPGTLMGTAEYMSPEQALGLVVDARSDIFSFGSTLYEMASGQRPFTGRTTGETLDRILHVEPEPLERLAPGVPGELSRILEKCLAKDPDRRYPSGRELHADLRSLADVLRSERARAPAVDASPAPPHVRLAVLPFENIGVGPDREYLADAFTEETIAALGMLDPNRLSVIGRTSVMACRRAARTLAEIGRELDATYLVESSIHFEASRIRVISKLIRASDQVQLWSASYDGEPSSMLAFQRELGTTIAEQIRLRLSPERLASLARRQTRNPQAYDLYLRGRHSWNQLTPATTRQAIDCFSRATEIDPDYALAWSGLADAWSASPVTGDAPPLGASTLARNAAARAVRAEPELAESQASSGFVTFWLDWRWAEAEAAFRKAISLDSNYAFAHRMLGLVLSHLGRYPEARQELQRARELDPLYAMHHALSSQVAFAGREPQAAIQFARQAIVIDPQFWIGHFHLAQACEQSGDDARALEATADAARLSGGNSKAISLRGYILARKGNAGEAQEVLGRLEAAARDRFVPPYAMALVHAGLGEREKAIDWLERAVEVRDVHLVFLPTDPKWDPLRADARFRSVLVRCGLPFSEPPLR